MQKLGVLYLRGGDWNGRRLSSRAWIEQSFTPWIHGDYGWYWWQYWFAPGWRAHVANGWKGQRIAVVPEEGVVVTMTACLEDGSEDRVFAAVMRIGSGVEWRMVPSIDHKERRKLHEL